MYALLLFCALLTRNTQDKINEHIPAKNKANYSTAYTKNETLPTVSTNTPSDEPQSQPHSDQNENNPNEGLKRIEIVPQSDIWFKGYVIGTFIIAALNFGMLVVIWRQRYVMLSQLMEMQEATKQTKNMITLMDDTATRQLRAYVCLASALLKFERPDAPEAQVWIKNYGQTPAYDVRHWIHIWIEEHPLKIVLPEPPENFEMYKAVIPPGGENVMVLPKVPPVQAEYVKLLGTRQGTIYVYGKVIYRDAFGIDRHLAYRLIYGGERGLVRDQIRNGIRTGMMKPDAEGNFAD